MRTLPTLLVLSAALLLAVPAAAQSGLTGRIVRFECGDNCYLTIKDDAGRERTGLCVATACRPWNDRTEMPRANIGRRVAVTLGTGVQVDGSGAARGRMTSFRSIRFLQR